MSELRLPKINSTIISGRLTADPDMKFIPSGTGVANFTLAFDRSFQANGEWEKKASFIPVTVWGKSAERVNNDLHKGSPVTVEGYLEQESWEDKDGNKRSKMKLVCNRIHFMEKSTIDNPRVTSPNVPDITDNDVPF